MENYDEKTRPGRVNGWIINSETKWQINIIFSAIIIKQYNSKDTLRIHLLGVHNYTLYLIMGGAGAERWKKGAGFTGDIITEPTRWKC